MMRVNRSEYPSQNETSCQAMVKDDKIGIVFDPVDDAKLAIIKELICHVTANTYEPMCKVNLELPGKNELTLFFPSENARDVIKLLDSLSKTNLNLKPNDVITAIEFISANFGVCNDGMCMR